MAQIKEYLTKRDTVDLFTSKGLPMSLRTLNRLMAQGHLRYYKVTNQVRFKNKDIVNYIDSQVVPIV